MEKLHNYYTGAFVSLLLFTHLVHPGETPTATLELKSQQPIKLFGDKVPEKIEIIINNANNNDNDNTNTNNPTISNTTGIDAHQANSQSAIQATTQSSTQTTKVHTEQILITKIRSQFSSISMDYYKARMHDAYASSTQWIFDHRIHLLLAAGVISYATVCYLVNRGFNYFKYSSYWGSWKRELTFEQFLSAPQDQITQDLIVTIQTEYINETNPTDFIQPLVHFTKDIETEMTTLHWYKKYFTILDRLYLSRITFLKPDYIADIQQKLERLAYIKQLFGQWLAQQNLDHIFDHPRNNSFYQRITRSVKKVLQSSTDTISRSYQSLARRVPSRKAKKTTHYQSKSIMSLRRYIMNHFKWHFS